jgi:ubiquinone/menaquinone biosynthesis C-methylase UbiE
MWSRVNVQHPFGLSLSKPCLSLAKERKQPFDRLRANGMKAVVCFLLAACQQAAPKSEFPAAGRDVAPIVGDSFSTEDARDRVGEAEAVIAFAGIAPGMSVADIGAGEGYYTVRLSRVVGPRGRVLAEDIVPSTRDRLALRVNRDNLINVAVRLGLPEDPKLPTASFDRIFLVHVYHEVDRPYEFLWNLRQGLKAGGLVVVVDADRPVKRHGTPPMLLDCEFASIGLERIKKAPLEGTDAYMALFKAARPLPEPPAIKPCAINA